MNRTGIIIQVRMGSTRFPGKVLKPLPPDGGAPVLEWVIRSCRATGYPVYVATSTNVEDDAIAQFVELRCKRKLSEPIVLFRGDPIDVLDRMYQCARENGIEEIVRITGDCCFIDPDIIRQVVMLRQLNGADYASNVDPPTWPDGLDVQCVTFDALETAWQDAKESTDRDTVLQYIVHHRENFSIVNLPCPLGNLSAHRWVLDTEDDYRICSAMARTMLDRGINSPRLVDLLQVAPPPPVGDLRNERYLAGRAGELKADEFSESRLINFTIKNIQPYGASTYSKSWVAWGLDAPLYVTHAQGSRVWDVDGNEFIDMTAGLGTTVLGHSDPYVRAAIERQLDEGIGFPLAHCNEHRIARKIVDRIMPGGKIVFGKNGSDVTSAAVRVARVFTGRTDDGVVALTGGYHGWHDWALYRTMRGYGVPDCGTDRRASIGDIEVGLHSDRPWAAVIVEPDKFRPEQLNFLIKICHSSGILVIFDEMVTAFRYPKLTYAATYGLKPDLICLGKALGNGMPVTCLIGRAEIMDRFVSTDGSPYAFYSGTHFGEMLSLAAAGAVIDRMTDDEQKRLCGITEKISSILIKTFKTLQDAQFDGATIHTGTMLPRITFSNSIIAAKFRREMAHNGVLVYSLFLPTLAHSDADISHVGEALERTFKALRDGIARGGDDIPGSGIMRS